MTTDNPEHVPGLWIGCPCKVRRGGGGRWVVSIDAGCPGHGLEAQRRNGQNAAWQDIDTRLQVALQPFTWSVGLGDDLDRSWAVAPRPITAWFEETPESYTVNDGPPIPFTSDRAARVHRWLSVAEALVWRLALVVLGMAAIDLVADLGLRWLS